MCGLAAIGLGMMAWDVTHPYKSQLDRDGRDFARRFWAEESSGAELLCAGRTCTCRWTRWSGKATARRSTCATRRFIRPATAPRPPRGSTGSSDCAPAPHRRLRRDPGRRGGRVALDPGECEPLRVAVAARARPERGAAPRQGVGRGSLRGLRARAGQERWLRIAGVLGAWRSSERWPPGPSRRTRRNPNDTSLRTDPGVRRSPRATSGLPGSGSSAVCLRDQLTAVDQSP